MKLIAACTVSSYLDGGDAGAEFIPALLTGDVLLRLIITAGKGEQKASQRQEFHAGKMRLSQGLVNQRATAN